MPIITAFATSPDRGRGLARDMPVRWALEELGQRYDVRLKTFAALKEPAHLAIQPFGQIPTYEEGDLALFETGAIVLHLAETHPGLLPQDVHARSRAKAWMFAAVATMQPPITDLEIARLFENDRSWSAERMPLVEERVRARLDQLSRHLGDAEWLDGEFSSGDLMMVFTLFRLAANDLLGDHPNLAAYVQRGTSRPAYQRAFAAQLAVFMATQQQ